MQRRGITKFLTGGREYFVSKNTYVASFERVGKVWRSYSTTLDSRKSNREAELRKASNQKASSPLTTGNINIGN